LAIALIGNNAEHITKILAFIETLTGSYYVSDHILAFILTDFRWGEIADRWIVNRATVELVIYCLALS